MSIQSTIEMTAGGATILAIVGSIAQVAPDPDGLSILGSFAQIGSAGLVLYTVRMFLQDRKEHEEQMAQERREMRQDMSALINRVEKIGHDQRQYLDSLAHRFETIIKEIKTCRSE